MDLAHNDKIQSIFSKGTCIGKKANYPEFLNQVELEKVKAYHETIKDYNITPLVDLKYLARHLGVKSIYIKDESKRLKLNSFKMLGASYAIGKFLCQKLGIHIEDTSFEDLKSIENRAKIGEITFVTCSDGNHGRGLAWTAKELGFKAVVYLPLGSSLIRVQAIRELGSMAIVTDLNYDNTVRYAIQMAKDNGWQMVQDTSWEGYTQIPKWIMQGYSAMGYEAFLQLKDLEAPTPTHVFLQAGVGAMAGGVLGAYANLFKENLPIITIMEPTNAACMFKSALINDGSPHKVSGSLRSIMAGLSCGEPIPMGWEIIRDFASCYCTCPDYVTARGMRILGGPIGEDTKIVSGESGAVGIGLLSIIMQKKYASDIREKLKLDKNSIVLLFSTEGDTDKENYRNILWDGLYELPSFN
ncbi:diaminopropionate ammonia-lyase [Clostridium lacusfryxellense]|uniref:diaminopropionate ammonia-lyase n=1 Tax=Clostridium lacusfryxellense TaxID=205328 RepID=UPI001C0B465E|nr:diaminopropionate ammonia-lyase [Clostridium lacusfryxellense]MBU3113432.1 diaminopropionate ammonia-lyase [Clostridium lacusfryxellense]